MDLGIALPTSGSWARPDLIADAARRAEGHGYRSIWTFQRLLFAGPPEDPGPLPDGTWPVVYEDVLDPTAVLGYAAAVTSTVRLGVAVLNGLFYSPVLLAKQIASLDVLSAGRLDTGIGLGWSVTEYAASGVEMRARGRRLDEFLRCLDTLLSGGTVEFEGEFYRVPRSHFGPPPVQRPHPPIFVGGGADAALRRAALLGDGWVSASRAGLEGIRTAARTVRMLASEQGRQVRIVSRGVVRLRDTEPAGERAPFEGTFDTIRRDLDSYADAGVDEVFLDLNFDPEVGHPRADPESSYERFTRVIDAFAPGGSLDRP